MARVLRRTVITGGKTYPPGTKETAALKKTIPNPAAWEGDGEDSAKSSRSSRSSGSSRSTSGGSGNPSEEPPRGGEGSGEDVWRAYAEGLGIEVPEGAGRDDIIALVDAHAAGDGSGSEK